MRAHGKPRAAAGFTLLEVLIAMVILAMAAAVILQHVRGLMDYARRAQIHYVDVDGMLNRAAEFGLRGPNTFEARMQADHIDLVDHGASKPFAQVFNLPFGGALIPIDKALSPYQLYMLPGDLGRSLPLLMPGLKPGEK